MMSSVEAEMGDAFDRFSLWTLVRHADTAHTVRLMCCGSIQPVLRNFLLVMTSDRESGDMSYTLLEHYLTKRQFDDVSQATRKDAIQTIGSFLNMVPNSAFHHNLHITNECPTIEINDPVLHLLKASDMVVGQLSSIPSHVLGVISVLRDMEDAHTRNAYDIRFSTGNTMRDVVRHAKNGTDQNPGNGAPSSKPYYCFDAHPINYIMFDKLANDLAESKEEGAPLGLFIMRQGVLDDAKRYLKRNCVDRLEDVTANTWFLVSESVPFTAPFPEHVAVHEVMYQKGYGVVLWQRSRGKPVSIAKYFTDFFWGVYESVPPVPGWLNVLISNETDGSTTYVQKVVTASRKTDPFRMVAYLQAIDIMDVLQDQNASTVDKLCSFFGARTAAERFAVTQGRLLLVVDHAFEDNGMGFSAQPLVDFLNSVKQHQTNRLIVWIVGNDRVWESVSEKCVHASIKYAMPPLFDTEFIDCLSELLKEGCGLPSPVSIMVHIIDQNEQGVEDSIFKNIFFLATLTNTLIRNEAQHGAPAYWWIEVLERYVWNNVAANGTELFRVFEKACYDRITACASSFVPLPNEGRSFQHRTLVKLMAARYLVENPHLIDVDKFRLFDRRLLDLLLFRHSRVGIAVLHNDLDTIGIVATNAPDLLQTTSDCLQRNILHIVDEQKMAQRIVAAGVSMEQRCPQLNNWTPLQLADDRENWALVDCLLAHGANVPPNNLRLHTMTLAELKEVFFDCMSYQLEDLIQWICDNRPDYHVSQHDVYCLVSDLELVDELLFQLLALAVNQRLPEREPEPYQSIWYNTALDVAVEDDRYEVAAFLVEKLNFPPNEGFNELRKRHLEQAEPGFKDYKTFYELCRAGNMEEVLRMITEKSLDPTNEYNGTNMLIQAAASGNLELVRHLYDRYDFKNSLNEADKHGETAMSKAMHSGCAGTIEFLHSCGANIPSSLALCFPDVCPDGMVPVDTEDFQSLLIVNHRRMRELKIDFKRVENGELFLHYYIRSAEKRDEDTFRYLVAQYTDVDVRKCADSYGETPFHIALLHGNERYAEILIEAGANVHAKSLEQEVSSLYFAIIGGVSKPMISLLVEKYGIDVNTRDNRGRSIAFDIPPDQILCQWLIDRYGLDVFARDHFGYTALHYRVQQNDYFSLTNVEFLLNTLRIPQELTDKRGRLALHYAVEVGELEIVRLLIKYRSDLADVPDGDGLTSVQLARNGANGANGADDSVGIKELLESITTHSI